MSRTDINQEALLAKQLKKTSSSMPTEQLQNMYCTKMITDAGIPVTADENLQSIIDASPVGTILLAYPGVTRTFTPKSGVLVMFVEDTTESAQILRKAESVGFFTPFYLMGTVVSLCAAQAVAAGANAASTNCLVGTPFAEFGAVVKLLASAAGTTSLVLTWEQSVDGGTYWATMLKDDGNPISNTITCASTTVPTIVSLPVIRRNGGLIRARLTVSTVGAVVTIDCPWRP